MAGVNGVTIAKNDHPHWKSSGILKVEGGIIASGGNQFFFAGSGGGQHLYSSIQTGSLAMGKGWQGSDIIASNNNAMDLIITANKGVSILGCNFNAGIINASRYNTTSDVRLKTNFEPLTNVIDSIKQIHGLKYNFKDSLSDKKSIGLIAQDVEKVFPEVVTTKEDGEKLKSIEYSNMVPILVEAIKEQQKMIEELQAAVKIAR
jgi:hypothetical protein